MRFAMVYESVIADNRLTLRQIRVLMALMLFADSSTGKCHPTREQLSGITGYQPDRISSITTELIGLGYLKKEGHGGRSSATDYTVVMPMDAAETLPDLGRDKPETLPKTDRVSTQKQAKPYPKQEGFKPETLPKTDRVSTQKQAKPYPKQEGFKPETLPKTDRVYSQDVHENPTQFGKLNPTRFGEGQSTDHTTDHTTKEKEDTRTMRVNTSAKTAPVSKSEPANSKPREPDIALNSRTLTWENISTAQRELWSRAYPALSLDAELASAAAWIVANPSNRKSNYARFLTNWLKRSQDRAPRVDTPKASAHAPYGVIADRGTQKNPIPATAHPSGSGLPKHGPKQYGTSAGRMERTVSVILDWADDSPQRDEVIDGHCRQA